MKAKATSAKGTRWQTFWRAYFQIDPLWVELLDEAWVGPDWLGQQSKPDTGVDLVASALGTGGLVTIQCKLYEPAATLERPGVSTSVAIRGQPAFT